MSAIASIQKMVRQGYQRLATAPVADVLRLMLHNFEEDGPLNLDTLDLSCIAEIKRKDGNFEVKFVNRLEALDRLAAMESAAKGSAPSFYQALEQGAKALGDTT